MDQNALIDRVVDALRPDERIAALFLSGSHGRGTADAFSDVDFLLIADPTQQEALAAAWRPLLDSMLTVVFFNRLPHALVLNAVSDEFLRCDLEIASSDRLAAKSQDGLRPLLDRSDLYAAVQPHLPAPRVHPGRLEYMVNEFIRIMGLFAVADGRGEYEVAAVGCGMLRRLLTDLLTLEMAIPDPGGMLHLSRVLDPERMALLAALPVARPERQSVIVAQLATARLFMPRARRMANEIGLSWPEAFEAAARKSMNRTLPPPYSADW